MLYMKHNQKSPGICFTLPGTFYGVSHMKDFFHIIQHGGHHFDTGRNGHPVTGILHSGEREGIAAVVPEEVISESFGHVSLSRFRLTRHGIVCDQGLGIFAAE